MRILVYSWLLFLMSFFQILFVFRVSGQCLNDQRSLLLQLKSTLVFDLTSSTKLVLWNQSVDCCNWDGVVCNSIGNVISLELDNESISGGIENSASLFSLKSLEKLNLAFNRFGDSSIPKGFQNLTNLMYLNLSNAGFGGQIPNELSAVRNLIVLDLSTRFPSLKPLKLENPNLSMVFQNLKSLSELYLDGVNISANGNDWCRVLSSSLPDLRNLSLRNCHLSGPLDTSLSQLHSISVLRLDGNNLSTAVPNFFANLSNLTILTLSSCSLRDEFPVMIFQVPHLQILDLSNNILLSGTIPEFPQAGSFETINLSYTNFSGSLPDSISNLEILSEFQLSNCNFTGKIPSSISNLKELFSLDFSFNSFTGSIPLFHMSKKMSYMDLSHNKLMGSLSPTHFEGLANLVFLNIGYNSLNGSIPVSLFTLPSLQKLELSNNRFTDQVKEFTLNSSNLDTVDLSSNRLEGSIPESFFKLKRLKVLSLSYNFFNGTVQLESIRNLGNLTRLELGYNNLTVSVSNNNSNLSQFVQLSRLSLSSCNLNDFPDLRNQSKLNFLDLSNNQISGGIPNWIWGVGDGTLSHLNLSSNSLDHLQKPYNISKSLSLLDLHENNLQGELPLPPSSAVYVDYSSNNFSGDFPLIPNFNSFASFFSIANNLLTGAIPENLCNASVLNVLDLSGNLFSGTIPPCLMENNANLGVLNLARNNITGEIPDRFSVNCGLKTLELGRNNLGGKIPATLANCKLLEVVNVGNNNIDDSFPCMLKNISSLRVLVLRSNRFYGGIGCPMVNQSWPNLQIIDVASNNFSGSLNPNFFLSWRGMTLDNDAQSTTGNNHLGFNFLDLNNFYYKDTVTVTFKGLEMELVKILTLFTSIDFSSNSFQGEIPVTIGKLSSLYVLNLSRNTFTGTIPRSIGNLTQLGSLDLSKNELTGKIPIELTRLSFLSVLNLSYNKLVGMIPQGTQFQTFSLESYVGNAGLCGFPLNTSCFTKTTAEEKIGSIGVEYDWQFIFTGLGYGIGAALVVAPLGFCKKWREKCNEILEQFLKMIFPRYGFSYVRYDEKVDAGRRIEDDTTDDDDDDDMGEELSSGRYCVFCTKLDIQIKNVLHNPNCTCHFSPPAFSFSPISYSSSSVLAVYGQNF